MRFFHEAWLEAVRETLRRPDHTVSPRGMLVRERIGVQLKFEASRSLLVHPARDLNYRFAVAEAVWIASGLNTVEPLARYNSVMRKFSDDGVVLAGAYGPRLATQWDWVVKQIVKDPDTRQAVANIWTPTPAPSKDIPCTLSAQFLLRENRLDAVWTMRSNDLWLGTPYDAFSFSFVTACLAGAVSQALQQTVTAGTITLNAGSSHIYQEHWAAGDEALITDDDAYSLNTSRLDGFPPPCLVRQLTKEDPCYCQSCLTREWLRYSRVLESAGKAEALAVLEE